MSLFNETDEYCKKCGNFKESYKPKQRNCPICHSMYNHIEINGFFEIRKYHKMIISEKRDYLKNKYNFPPIEPEWEQKREEYYKKDWEQYQKEQEAKQQKRVEESFRQFQYKQEHAPKCPTCGSTNISNIGTISRAVSVGTLGLASSKIGKTRKCGSCGYMW